MIQSNFPMAQLNYLLGDCKNSVTPLNGIIIVELKQDVPLVPACLADNETFKNNRTGWLKYKTEDMGNIHENLTESMGNLTQLTNDSNGEYLWEPRATKPLTAQQKKALERNGISIPVIVGQNNRETVFGMGYDYSTTPPGVNKVLAVHSFKNKTKAFCELLGICERGAHPTDPPTTPTTPTTTEPPPPPTTPTTRPPSTTYYVPAIQEDEEMSSFEIPYDRKVVKGGSAKIQIIWILLIAFVWF
ncbi:hypothetical protein GCK72_011643 [Caenorhabditis remanei]|uniref:Uncharacterized protein n=1 Tax=Caenorhabditis remanei TaxID=31234 RepID=A0A6A5H852_CAERE|nr:hypothetical protein GCK72_011643 [Caenorhabditis remanei]KAF1763377.1 hypothetical protein GCK72_011643 [Caenorhabditis remanei]